MSEQLTPLERAVIALSCKDPISSLRPGGRRRGWIMGLPTGPLPLANPRLEALRRYAILRRVHGAAKIEAERERLREAGFGHEQIEEVDDLVDPSRQHRRAPSRAERSLFIFDGSCFPAVRWN